MPEKFLCVHHKNFDSKKAIRHLTKQDPKLGRLIKSLGSFEMKRPVKQSAFHRLIRSIIFQQLHGKAAATIHQRTRDLFGGKDPTAEQLLKITDKKLAKAGLSRQKIAALKDLAKAAAAGQVPDEKAIKKMSDEEIIEHLIPIRGVGRWTVEMLLMFGLGRADVLAVDDFAIKKATMILYGLKEMPDKKTMKKVGESWAPYRSVACWYLWRSLDPK